MRSRPSPISSASSADSSADWTIASRSTSCADSGPPRSWFSSISRVSSAWSSEPQFDADAHRLVVADRRFDDLGELPVLLFLEADIARIDAVHTSPAPRRRRDDRPAICGRYSENRRPAALRGRVAPGARGFSEPRPHSRPRSTVMRTISDPVRLQRRHLGDRGVHVGRVGIASSIERRSARRRRRQCRRHRQQRFRAVRKLPNNRRSSPPPGHRAPFHMIALSWYNQPLMSTR